MKGPPSNIFWLSVKSVKIRKSSPCNVLCLCRMFFECYHRILNVNVKRNYIKNGNFVLADIDECTLGVHNCSSHAVCINTHGGFQCQCALGYDGSGFRCEG